MIVGVVGGTGVLAPLVRRLVADGDEVRVVSRVPAVPGRSPSPAVLRGDLHLPEELARSLSGCDAVIVYAADADADELRVVGSAAPRRLFVLPSRFADPVTGASTRAWAQRLDGLVVLLGWRPDGAWHTAAEVSDAAYEAWTACQDGQLGRLRPWSERPVPS